MGNHTAITWWTVISKYFLDLCVKGSENKGCICIHICMHIYRHTHKYLHSHIHHAHTCAHMHTETCMYKHACTCTYTHKHIHCNMHTKYRRRTLTVASSWADAVWLVLSLTKSSYQFHGSHDHSSDENQQWQDCEPERGEKLTKDHTPRSAAGSWGGSGPLSLTLQNGTFSHAPDQARLTIPEAAKFGPRGCDAPL